MPNRALVAQDGSVLGIAEQSDAQLTEKIGVKPRWLPLVDEQQPLGPGQRYGAPVLTVRADDVLRAWPIEAVPVPQRITPLQMRRALRQQGYVAVKTALATASADLQDQWESMQVVERSGEFVAFLKTTLAKSDAQIDAFFRLASAL